MDRIYRPVFVKALVVSVVRSEITNGRGKGDGTTFAVGAAASAALLAVGMAVGGDAFSQASPCPAVIDASITGPCLITGGLEVANSISVTGGQYGLLANSLSIISGTIENRGTVRGTLSGIQLGENVSLSGGRGLVNWAGGLIDGGNIGISVNGNSTLSGDIGINNQGTISATGPGISISPNGVVNGGIYNIGIISSRDGQGISISKNGTLYGRITNDGAAARMPGVINAGTIFGGSTPIDLIRDSTMTGGIRNSGTIIGSGLVINIGSNATLTGGINNTGSITNEGDASFDLLRVDGSGTKIVGDITNGATGRLISNLGLDPGSNGVFGIQWGATLDGSIINDGEMLGAGYGIVVLENSLVSGSIINNVGGSILSDNGAPGNAIWLQNYATLRGALSNAGTISGMHGGVGVIEFSTIAEGVTNSGTISGGDTGINVYGNSTVSGGIINSGTISGGDTGINVYGNSTIAGGIINSGTIIGSNDYGISVANNSTITGGITNNGTISGGTTGINVDDNSTIAGGIANSGTISGGNTGINVHGNSTMSDISNAGHITGSTVAGIALTNSSIDGAILNSEAGTISGGSYGLLANTSTITGNITNSGLIDGTNTGIYLNTTTIGESIAGGITNSGTISGGETGIYVDGNSSIGEITNTGLITGSTVAGMSLTNSSIERAILNAAAGTISGGQYGLVANTSTITGNINNSGLIDGTHTGIYLNSTAVGDAITGSNANNGTISGGNFGIYVDGGSTIVGGITNRGTIIGSGIQGIYVNDNSTIAGGINNSGTISGGNAGIYVDGFSTIAGGITNAGTIIGSGLSGLNVNYYSTIAGGITNAGTIISSGLYGLNVNYYSTIAGGITNSGTISGGETGINVDGNSSISEITNTGLITGSTVAGISLTNSSIGGTILNAAAGTISGGQYGLLANTSTITGNISNSGLIAATNTGINLTSTSMGGSIINNSGAVISGGNVGVFASASTIGAINNSDSATITGDSSIVSNSDAYGIYGNSTIGALNNSGSINAYAARNAYAVSNFGDAVITTLNNAGTIMASSINGSSTGVDNIGTIVAFNNSGTISANAFPGGVVNGVFNSGNIGEFFNSGTISASSEDGASAVGFKNTGLIDVFTNTGVIVATDPVRPTAGVYNLGAINNLNNTQGGNSKSAATTALNYYGNLPTNYKIGIVSSSHYGQLSVANPVGAIANFGIYGSPVIATRIYPGVLSNTVTVKNLQAKYDNLIFDLVNNTATGKYDLIFTSPSDTQKSLVNAANAIAPVYAMQNAVLVDRLTYDCTIFDLKNICISVVGRDSKLSSHNGLNDMGGLFVAAYRPHPNYRIGAYADQNLSASNSGRTVKVSNRTPLIGIFGAWAQNQDGTGPEVRFSAAYGQKQITINRLEVGLSEPGSGSSTLNYQGAQITARYGFGIINKLMLSPYIGMRYTRSNMGGYTEGSSATVIYPLTYSTLNTNATTALAGVRVSYKFIPTVTAFASAAIETDTRTSQGTYSATGMNGLASINFHPNLGRTRRTATVGAYYDIAKNQRLGVTGAYRQEAYQAVSSRTVMATYTVGF